MTDLLLNCIGAGADKRLPAAFAGDRWLVIGYEGEPIQVETYRQVCSQICLPTDLKKILMVLAGGMVESLSE